MRPVCCAVFVLLVSTVACDTSLRSGPLLAAGFPSWDVSSDLSTYLPLGGEQHCYELVTASLQSKEIIKSGQSDSPSPTLAIISAHNHLGAVSFKDVLSRLEDWLAKSLCKCFACKMYASSNLVYASALWLMPMACTGDVKLPKESAVITYRFNITNNDTAVPAATYQLNLTLDGLTLDNGNSDYALRCNHESGQGGLVGLQPGQETNANLFAANEVVTCNFSISAANHLDGVLPAVTIYAQLLDAQGLVSGLDSNITIGPVYLYSGSSLWQASSDPIIHGGMESGYPA